MISVCLVELKNVLLVAKTLCAPCSASLVFGSELICGYGVLKNVFVNNDHLYSPE